METRDLKRSKDKCVWWRKCVSMSFEMWSTWTQIYRVNLLLWSCTITVVQKQRTWFPYETVALGLMHCVSVYNSVELLHGKWGGGGGGGCVCEVLPRWRILIVWDVTSDSMYNFANVCATLLLLSSGLFTKPLLISTRPHSVSSHSPKSIKSPCNIVERLAFIQGDVGRKVKKKFFFWGGG